MEILIIIEKNSEITLTKAVKEVNQDRHFYH